MQLRRVDQNYRQLKQRLNESAIKLKQLATERKVLKEKVDGLKVSVDTSSSESESEKLAEAEKLPDFIEPEDVYMEDSYTKLDR